MNIAQPQTERPLPKPLRIALRELERDLDEGRISGAQYDALVEELLLALGVPLAHVND